MTVLLRICGALFSGYMGLDMAVGSAFGGLDTVFTCDDDPGALRLLAVRYPHVPNLGDITTVDWGTVPRVDVLFVQRTTKSM